MTLSTILLLPQLIIGSYTSKGNPGIEVFNWDAKTGAATKSYSLTVPQASYQAISGDYLFSVSEEGDGKASVSSFQMRNGKYEAINTEFSLKGDHPCHLTYREKSKTIYTANYTGGSVSVFQTANGRLKPLAQYIAYTGSSVNKDRQNSAHAHMVALSPDQNTLFVTDLGSDKIYAHAILADGRLAEGRAEIALTSGNGPRHIRFNAKGDRAYLLNELSSDVDVFAVKGSQLNKIQSIPADTSATKVKGSADIHISPNGKWLMSSNRISSNQVVVFKIEADGQLTRVFHQNVAKIPRNFTFDPSGNFVLVASQEEDRVQVFHFDDKTGSLKDSHQDILAKSPVSLLIR
ncbi:lactonase family protein [Aquirufa lenticrescens]|uniref:lactonase family protein n=1 Tax=Aquirufa lenticrescens TaxID=2696560 RepID=UPI001CAA7294|nr:lactonase family protein [Aquirufa lenticrescens]UAJ13893.1 lactonase family protein [Aquirufa lenticrescens]